MTRPDFDRLFAEADRRDRAAAPVASVEHLARRLADTCHNLNDDAAVLEAFVAAGIRPSEVADRFDAIRAHARRLIDQAGDVVAAGIIVFGGPVAIALCTLLSEPAHAADREPSTPLWLPIAVLAGTVGGALAVGACIRLAAWWASRRADEPAEEPHGDVPNVISWDDYLEALRQDTRPRPRRPAR